ncbi:uncharacterized protein METZ01_LOCUS140594 [marine metagenome]|uniref:Uncharacterized protein n=1 Tax=marine metagenome TaxID=408172 RepID=A0A381ZET9_9ZZZZ
MQDVYTLSRPIVILSCPLSATKTGKDQPALSHPEFADLFRTSLCR